MYLNYIADPIVELAIDWSLIADRRTFKDIDAENDIEFVTRRFNATL